MKKIIMLIFVIAAIATAIFFVFYYFKRPTSQPFDFKFDHPTELEEAGQMRNSKDPDWWLSSGGLLLNSAEVQRGSTIQGDLPAGSRWQAAYAASNPGDTDNGSHPQNIFRLVGRHKWQDFQQQAYFKIVKDNLSPSLNRNESNGLFLFNCYQDSDNLYYAGIRVDGAAVIKKKIKGVYYELRYKAVFVPGTYNRDTNPNLLPKNVWIGLRTEVTNSSDGLLINLYMDEGKTGTWALIASATDDGSKFGGDKFVSGYGGLRTDFMDVQFSDYHISKF